MWSFVYWIDVFKTFEKNGEFYCMPRQIEEGATVMFNFYRATQVIFPGETILEEGNKIATNFLFKKRAANHILDKWVITKDLLGEVYISFVPYNLPLLVMENIV